MKNRLLLLLLFLTACEQALFDKSEQSNDPYTNFDYLWNEVNRKYSLLDYKQVDWDAIKVTYRAKLYPGISNDSLFSVMGSMLNELQDGHVNLSSYFQVSRFNIHQLGLNNINFRLIEDNYLPAGYYVTGPFRHDFIANRQVGYIRFAEFTGTVNNSQLDFMLNRYKDTQGLILDVRQNGGGVAADIYMILNRFVDKKILLWRTYLKSGPGRNEFSDYEDSYAEPEGKVKYLKKVIVLSDRGTYSAGSYFALSTKAIDNVILLGDTTGGGLGMPNGGQLPNGWVYRFSVTKTLDINGNNYESGVPPDIYQVIDPADLKRDRMIDRAVEELL